MVMTADRPMAYAITFYRKGRRRRQMVGRLLLYGTAAETGVKIELAMNE
jgi:hypothetical protein